MSTVSYDQPTRKSSDRTLIKGLITGILILVMLIPTLFVASLVREREDRQKEIVKEVSSKWAPAQKISGPYISVPYVETTTDTNGKQYKVISSLLLLPENLSVSGKSFLNQNKDPSIK